MPGTASVPLTRPLVMGIVNVTPDSFSDGGKWFDEERAVAMRWSWWRRGRTCRYGGESTQPSTRSARTRSAGACCR